MFVEPLAFALSRLTMWVDLNGPNQCEVIEPHEMQAITSRLGPDPLREDAQPKLAWDRIHKARARHRTAGHEPVGYLWDREHLSNGVYFFRAQALAEPSRSRP